MITIDQNKCIGCGECVADCTVRDIKIVDGKAEPQNKNCFSCGHCIAVCPVDAVLMDEYNMEDVKAYDKESFDISPENLLNFIQFRRSVRRFKKQTVDHEKILKIIEAGRFTQTGTNSQDLSYIVVEDKVQELRALTLESLNNLGEYLLANITPETSGYTKYAKMWVHNYKKYQKDPNCRDLLFYDAPVLIVVTANSGVNGALASTNMELMTNALGLGTFYSGFLARAAKDNKKIHDLLGIEEGKELVTCLVVGYPDVAYHRTVPRKNAVISWK